MSRLIDADELETDMLYAMCGTGYQHLAMSTVRSARTIDAEPVKHGHWNKAKDFTLWCSVCTGTAPYDANYYGDVIGTEKYPYCPYCGARMEDNEMKKYLILSYDTCPYETDAVDIFEAIKNFAKYCGDDSELFLAALNGARTVEEGIRMFNHFCTYTIVDVYGVSCHYKCHYKEPFEEYHE